MNENVIGVVFLVLPVAFMLIVSFSSLWIGLALYAMLFLGLTIAANAREAT